MKRPLGITIVAGFALVALGAATPAHHTHATTPAVHKMKYFLADSIQWGEAPRILPPGAQMALLEGDPKKAGPITFRIKLPDGYKVAPHYHSTAEHVTVLSGEFHLGMGDTFEQSDTQTLPAGAYAIMPARMHHFASCVGPTEIQVHTTGPWTLTYVHPADNPSRKASTQP